MIWYACLSLLNGKTICQPMLFWYLIHWRAMKSQRRLSKCAVLPEHLLLAHTKNECRWKLQPKFKSFVKLCLSAYVFKAGFCEYAIVPKSYMLEQMFKLELLYIFRQQGMCCVHWRSSHYAVTHMRNVNSNNQGRSPNVVKVIFHTIRNCS